MLVEKAEEVINEVEDEDEDEDEVEDEDDLSWSSDSEIGEPLDYLDSMDYAEILDGTLTLHTRRPNAHGGLHSRPNTSSLQPLANKNQKFTSRIRESEVHQSHKSFSLGGLGGKVERWHVKLRDSCNS